ncbi:phage terminase, large subunit [Candidatus Velamenicoccus archaeovorus]|uniref:Phage terminase, large subunit n=1 Tax=Velamenicoccus archaeovorus TaxID=1930593 RepID=A0A410P7C6_VELA1|nr:phage terminase, large subunit [Candidatus Velamenicoccus archaeovorus]
MTVSEWADTFRRLDVKTSAEPGQWSTTRTPYLKGIMDAFTDPFVDEITVMAASQVGKTEAMYNMLGYVIDQDPGPTLMVSPRADDAKSVSYNRIRPMIEVSPVLSKYLPENLDDITKLEYHFDRMILYFAGSNSPADLASRPIRYLFLDEVDKYPKFSGREADPIKLASERQKTFWNKKTIKVSTPTTREGYIFREYEKSDQRRFYVPCPHCGKLQVLLFGQIKWPREESSPERIKNERFAWYECFYCGKKIEDLQKQKIMQSGEWIPEKKEKNRNRGFWVSSLYSPWLTWSDIAAEFLKSKDYIELLMNFVNSWLAEVWEEKIEETTVDKVRNLARDYDEGIVPDEVLVLTAGVDVQKDHFYFVIRGWGYYEESWLIRAGRAEYWDDLVEALFKTEYKRLTSNETLNIYMSCVDSGFRTDEVYRFCRSWSDKTKAIKGVEEISGGRFYRANKIDINSRTGAVIPGGLVLWHLNVTQYKDKINRLVTSRDPVKWHIFKNPGEEYLAQFTSEHKILIRNRTTGRAKEVWQKKKEASANHFLDAEVYALAAADIIRALNIRKDGAVRVYQPKAKGEEHSRQEWIRKREGSWL